MDQAADSASTTSPDTEHTEHQVVRLPAVLQATGLARSTLYALMAGGNFPASVRLSQRTMGWRLAEVHAWLARRAADHRYRPAGREAVAVEGGEEA